MYINVAPKAIVDKNTKIAVKNFSVNQFSISELDKYKIFQNNNYLIFTSKLETICLLKFVMYRSISSSVRVRDFA